jgi:thiamine-phosphate pyrophosphorylase
MAKAVMNYSLYLVTDQALLGGKQLAETVDRAIQGGVTVVQLREKNLSSLEFFQVAREIKTVTDKYGVPLIVNDRADIALAVDAAGLHVGQADLPVGVARQLLGPDKIIGVSVANRTEAILAAGQGADYLGGGAIFPTNTKTDADYVSLTDLAAIKQEVTIPVVAIGGINGNNITEVMASGADGAAVVSAIVAAQDPYKAAAALEKLVKGAAGPAN